jgi:hypothetical protein
LPFARQRLNEVAFRVEDEAEAPNRYDGTRLGVDGEIPTRQHRLHIAVLQGRLMNGAGDVVRCLVLWVVEVRYGGIKAWRREDKTLSTGQLYRFPFAAKLKGLR